MRENEWIHIIEYGTCGLDVQHFFAISYSTWSVKSKAKVPRRLLTRGGAGWLEREMMSNREDPTVCSF